MAQTCKICADRFSGFFEKDFKDGICLPCQVDVEQKIEDEKELQELIKFNKKYGTNYDIQHFWWACEAKEKITREMTNGFKRLKSIFDYTVMIEEEQAQADAEYDKRMLQPELFDFFDF